MRLNFPNHFQVPGHGITGWEVNKYRQHPMYLDFFSFIVLYYGSYYRYHCVPYGSWTVFGDYTTGNGIPEPDRAFLGNGKISGPIRFYRKRKFIPETH